MSLLPRYIKFLGDVAGKEIESAVFDFLPRGNLRYVDCGCDSGEKTVLRAERIGTEKVLGVESVGQRAKLAKKNGLKVLQFDLNGKWKVGSNQVDIITATEVVEHLVDLDNFFSEAKRVLVKKGKIIISTENLAAWHNILALFLGNQPYTGPYLSRFYAISPRPNGKFFKDKIPMNPHLNVMTALSLERLLKAYGFRVIESRGTGFYPIPTPISKLLNLIDKKHSSYIIAVAQKI